MTNLSNSERLSQSVKCPEHFPIYNLSEHPVGLSHEIERNNSVSGPRVRRSRISNSLLRPDGLAKWDRELPVRGRSTTPRSCCSGYRTGCPCCSPAAWLKMKIKSIASCSNTNLKDKNVRLNIQMMNVPSWRVTSNQEVQTLYSSIEERKTDDQNAAMIDNQTL